MLTLIRPLCSHVCATPLASSLLVAVFLGCAWTVGQGADKDAHRSRGETSVIGVNLACGEFGNVPGTFNKDYTYPGARQFDYCKNKELRVVRLPIRWERVQPKLMEPLDATEMARLDQVVELARERGLRLLFDVHNYARYNGKLIGTDDVPIETFSDFWRRFADHYKDESAVFAYGLMNEPHGTQGRWPTAAQAGVDAIRSVDGKHAISVCGDGWSGAHSWKKINNDFGAHKESYHYSNEGSEFRGESAEDDGRRVRKITYRHQGQIAWVGFGLYFGELDCAKYAGFRLEIRSDHPCRLEVKAYPTDGKACLGVFNVDTQWQDLDIPFRQLNRGGETFGANDKLLKIEFQPSRNDEGNSVLLGKFILLPANP